MSELKVILIRVTQTAELRPQLLFFAIFPSFRYGIHVETSVVYSKGNEEEVIKVAETLSDISPTIPVQVMRFIPFGGCSN